MYGLRLAALGEADRWRRGHAEVRRTKIELRRGCMQTKTAVGLAAVVTVGIALFPMSAKAVCQQTIYAERAHSDGSQVQILGHVASTDEFAYFATTADGVSELISAAVAQRNRVLIVGNAQSCP